MAVNVAEHAIAWLQALWDDVPSGPLVASVAVITVILTICVLQSQNNGKNIPGPSRLEALRGLVLDNRRILKYKKDWKQRFGRIYNMTVGRGQVFLTDYDAIYDALVRNADVCSLRPSELAKVTAGSESGIIFSPHYKEQRKFALTVLREQGMGKIDMEYKILEEIRPFIKEIEARNHEPLEMDDYTHRAVSNVICNLVFGSRFEYEDPVFISILNMFLNRVKFTRTAFVINSIPLLKKLPGDIFGFHRFMRQAEESKSFFREAIRKHKETLNEEDLRDFIDAYLVEMKAQASGTTHTTSFDEENCISAVIQLFIAGSDTTATALLWSWLFMMLNPEVQRKVHLEIDQYIGSRQPSLSDKVKMPYTEAVLTEVLRIGNIAPDALPHKADSPINIGEYVIPAGATVLASLSDVHLDESVYPAPMAFKPERFLSLDGKFEKPKYFIPFGIGRRVCIGESLAKAEFFLFFTSILQRFDLIEPPGSSYKAEGTAEFVHRPKSYKVVFRSRKFPESNIPSSS